MNELRTDIYFFPWFEHNYGKINTREVDTISRAKNSWIKLQNNEIIHEEYTPYESITISHRGSQIVASPLKNTSLSDDNKNMDNIIQQNNFTNTYIKVLGEKLERIENQINPLTIKDQEKETKRPLFIPYETPPNLQFSLKNDNTELLEEISKRLDTLKINNHEIKNHASTSNHNKEILTIKKSHEETDTEVDTESYIDKLQSQFRNLDLNRMTSGNRNDQGRMPRNNYKGKYATHTSITCNWYPKPTPPDIQFEERELGIRAAYIAEALYEWNVDCLSEYEILNVLHEMMIVANVYKCAKRSDHQVASSLITGFTGQLKGWRDNTLTEEQRSYLKIAYKTDIAGNVIANEHN
jgi:3-dehydroquinate dehydratase